MEQVPISQSPEVRIILEGGTSKICSIADVRKDKESINQNKEISFTITPDMISLCMKIIGGDMESQEEVDIGLLFLSLGSLSAALPTFSHNSETPILIRLAAGFHATPKVGAYKIKLDGLRTKENTKVIKYEGSQAQEQFISGKATLMVDAHPYVGEEGQVSALPKLDTEKLKDPILSSPFVISQADQDLYAKISGDHSKVHLDPEYAAKSRFRSEKTIVYGTLAISRCLLSFLRSLKEGFPSNIVSFNAVFQSPIITDVTRVTPVLYDPKPIEGGLRYRFSAVDDEGNQLINGFIETRS